MNKQAASPISPRTPRILTKEEYSREWAGEITLRDFDTNRPNPSRLYHQLSAWRFNSSNKRREENRHDREQ